jgi:hypothetical protein
LSKLVTRLLFGDNISRMVFEKRKSLTWDLVRHRQPEKELGSTNDHFGSIEQP